MRRPSGLAPWLLAYAVVIASPTAHASVTDEAIRAVEDAHELNDFLSFVSDWTEIALEILSAYVEQRPLDPPAQSGLAEFEALERTMQEALRTLKAIDLPAAQAGPPVPGPSPQARRRAYAASVRALVSQHDDWEQRRAMCDALPQIVARYQAVDDMFLASKKILEQVVALTTGTPLGSAIAGPWLDLDQRLLPLARSVMSTARRKQLDIARWLPTRREETATLARNLATLLKLEAEALATSRLEWQEKVDRLEQEMTRLTNERAAIDQSIARNNAAQREIDRRRDDERSKARDRDNVQRDAADLAQQLAALEAEDAADFVCPWGNSWNNCYEHAADKAAYVARQNQLPREIERVQGALNAKQRRIAALDDDLRSIRLDIEAKRGSLAIAKASVEAAERAHAVSTHQAAEVFRSLMTSGELQTIDRHTLENQRDHQNVQMVIQSVGDAS